MTIVLKLRFEHYILHVIIIRGNYLSVTIVQKLCFEHFILHAIIIGETTRKGFYLYDDKRKASPDPELRKYIEKARSISGATIDPKVSFLSYSLHNNCSSLPAFLSLMLYLYLMLKNGKF